MDLADPRSGTRQLVAQGASFSGHERNHLFVQRRVDGERVFEDLSLQSGMDSGADGRAFAWLDYDQDGRRDVVLTNANFPRVELYRNQVETTHHWLGIELEGGNRLASASTEWSSRDAIGATLRVGIGERVEVLEKRLGEGFAAQNGERLLLGLGESQEVSWVEVQWPSGKQSRFQGPWKSDQVLRFHEDPALSVAEGIGQGN
jgi:hypothetical protein